jgi:hypothetical protein
MADCGPADLTHPTEQLMRSWSPYVRDDAGIVRLLLLIAGAMAAMAPLLEIESAAAQDVRAAIRKANAYIEVARSTERAVDSWERYASWVNMKTGPTGKERYISYGMYDLHDYVRSVLREAREAAKWQPSTPKLDALMQRCMDAYELLEPVMNRASAYYDREGYKADAMAEGRALHVAMVPLAKAFLAEREAMLRELRVFVREVERQEIAAVESREGRTLRWQAAHVVHAARRVFDVFPRERPTPIAADAFEERLKAIGPDTRGEKLDELIAGVERPKGVVIDVARFAAATKRYAEAVAIFERFAAEQPDALKDFRRHKHLPRQLLEGLRALQAALVQSQGRDFDGSGPLVNRLIQSYFSLQNAASPVAPRQLRHLE